MLITSTKMPYLYITSVELSDVEDINLQYSTYNPNKKELEFYEDLKNLSKLDLWKKRRTKKEDKL